MRILFIGGVHGVGKSTACKFTSKLLGTPHFSSSEIIKKVHSEGIRKSDKSVNEIKKNQDFLIQGLNELRVTSEFILLDGHFILLNLLGDLKPVPTKTFLDMKPMGICILTDTPSSIIERLTKRDNKKYSLSNVEQMQKLEVISGKEIARNLNIPLKIISNRHRKKLCEFALNFF